MSSKAALVASNPPVFGAPDQPAEDLGSAPLVGLVPAAGQSLQVRPEHRHHVLAKVSEQTLEQIEPLDAEPVTEKKTTLSISGLFNNIF